MTVLGTTVLKNKIARQKLINHIKFTTTQKAGLCLKGLINNEQKPDVSCPGVQMALAPHGFGKHKSSLVKGRQLMKGSPVIWRGQLQIGVKPLNLQSALTPQAPSQGFLQTPQEKKNV